MNRHACLALLLAACGGSSTPAAAPATSESAGAEADRFAMVELEDVAARIDASSAEHPLALLDANSRHTYDEHHLPTARWVDYDALTAEQLPADHAEPLVFYCHDEDCQASHVAARAALEMGFSSVSVMHAGLQGWIDSGRPVETTPGYVPEPD